MENLLFILSLLISTIPLFSQDQDKEVVGDEPYPAPVMYHNLSLQEAKLIKQFESKDVSNLHIYADVKQDGDYFFKGKPLDADFSEFFSGDLEEQTKIKGQEPQAVFSIRGEAKELYIIRTLGNGSGHEIALYELDNGKLQKYLPLASYQCQDGKCTQLDSWIQDINGDTRLDIIQVAKLTGKNGKEKISSKVYLMDQEGHLIKSKNTKIDLDDYPMQSLW
ncbi:MAG: hypothetical protein R2825_05695 [Saprospiraceae bacterium]